MKTGVFVLYIKNKYIIFMAMLLALSGGFAARGMAADAPKSDSKTVSETDMVKTHYVKIPALILPVIGDNGVEQIVSIVVLIEATSKESADSINEAAPRINDAFITELYGSLDRRERMKNGLLDVVYLKQRMTELAVKITGPDKIKDILIQGVSQHQS